MSEYIVIRCTEDGEVYMNTYSAETLKKNLNEDYWGRDVQFLKSPPSGGALGETEVGIFIIKGEIVSPRVKEVVTQWEL